MINNFKKILVLSCLIFLTNCGYAPLLNSEKEKDDLRSLIEAVKKRKNQ